MTHRDIAPLARVVARADSAAGGEPDIGIVPTGFPSFDRAIGGGFRRGDLAVLGGDDGAGCSALALAIALRRPLPALLLTTEMHPDRIYERALASSGRVSLEALRLGTITEEDRVRLAAAALALRDRAPVVDRLGHDGVSGIARAIEATTQSSLVIVDGLEGLLERDSPRDESLAFAVLSLKRLALERNIALLLLSHLPRLDRARQNLRPQLSDFGACGAVGVHADLVLGLYRDEMYDAELGLSGATELRVLKQRDGALGYADLYYVARHLRFEDVLDPEP